MVNANKRAIMAFAVMLGLSGLTGIAGLSAAWPASAALQATATPQSTGTGVIPFTPISTLEVTSTRATTGTTVPTQVAVPTVPVGEGVYAPGGQGNFPFADPAFQRVWNRTDALVRQGVASRTWFWGPGPNTVVLIEPYRQGQGGQHIVQYFDKSRMEINNPAGNRNDPFFVTNGLLTVDLIAGSIQVGDQEFAPYLPACIPMSGDFGDTLAPTYFAFQKVSVNGERVDTHQAQSRIGQRVTETIDRDGNTGTDASKSNVPGVEVAQFITETRHNIPRAFWDFLTSGGPVQNDQGRTVSETLISPWFFASGYPISEAYWTRATISGTVRDVLIQAYEHRALTYVPTNPPGFQVEMANIGQHYFDWRYRNIGICPGQTPTSPTPPVLGTAVSASPTVTGTVGTATAVTGTDTPTPRPTTSVTVVVPPGTVVTAIIVTPTGTGGPTQSATAATGATATSTVAPANSPTP